MKNLKRSILATLLVLVLLISSAVFSFAAGTQPDSYSTESNSGQRNVVCTTLDGTSASSYYTGSYTYDSLSALSSSSLLTSLRTKLSNTHTKNSSYDDCKTMADYTDCQNNSGKLVTLYTSYVTSYDANVTNREHVWPKSLGGYETSGPGADLHHIRPTEIVPNSNRGSLKYGNVSGGTTSYGDTSGYEAGEYGSYFEPLDNVKGDVARICLYMYVRYGGDNSYTCGDVTKVFQSVEVLLAWCELDPVDTWEMGRNEVVAAYQGNRNVFIDYPEYAWLLFDQEVPNDMVTPSGEAMGESTSSGGVDSSTGSSSESAPANTTPGWYLVEDASTLKAGDKIVIASNSKGFVAGSISSQIMTNVSTTFSSDKKTITTLPDGAVQLTLGGSSGAWTLAGSDGKLLGATAAKKLAWGSGTTTWSISISGGDATIQNGTSTYGRFLYNVSSPRFTTYTSGTSTTMLLPQIYRWVEGSSACTHTNTTTTTNDATCTEAGSITVTCESCGKVISTEVIEAKGHTEVIDAKVDPTCTESGLTAGSHCSVCNAVLIAQETIPTLDHNYVDGSCSACGKEDPNSGGTVTATGNIQDYAEANGWTNSTQYLTVILDENITITADGGGDTGKYYENGYNWRLYQSSSSTITISANDGCTIMSVKITYTSSNSGVLKNGDVQVTSGTDVVVNGSSITFSVGNTGSATNGQARITDIEVIYTTSASSDCEHTNTTATTVDATCTEAGSVTVTCDSCGTVISTEVIEAKGHIEETLKAVEATCTKVGYTEGKQCSVCNEITVAQETIPMVDHNYVDGSCSACGKKDPNSGGTVTATGKIKDYADANGWTNSAQYDTVNLDENITITAAGGRDTGKYYESDGSWRIYQSESGTITISAKDGCTIISVKITYSSSNSGVLLNGDAQVTSGTVVAVNESSITFGVGNTGSATNGQARITNIEVIYTTSVSSDCEHTNTTTSTTATCTESGVTTVFCHDCQTIISTENTGALEHDYVDGVCVRCGDAESTDAPTESGWVLVTDASSLKAGDQIVIVAQGADYALSTTQNNNNRGAAAITKNGTTISISEGVQVIELEAGTVDGTFAFNTGDGYLYAVSSSNNYLRTKAELDANGSWLITIDGNGVASVVAQGTNSRNTMQYNPNNGNGSPLFACYSSASQSAIQIYKYVEGSSSEGEENIIGASITIGSTLAVNYYVSGYSEADINGYYMVFTMNGTVSEHVHGNVKNGYLVFSFTNVAPQFMGDNISATLYSSDGTELDTVAEYSIKSYSQRIMDTHPDEAELKNLVADLLRYGAAAQNYRNYKTDELVTEGFELDGLGSSEAPKDYDNIRDLVTEDGKDTSVYTFTAVGVRFDYDNKIYVKFRAEDLANVKLVINGTEIEAEGNAQDVGEGVYILYTDGVSATQFDKEFTIELHVNSELYQTITYSVNSYSYAKQESTTPYLADLVLALYRYGLSAKAYPAKANA